MTMTKISDEPSLARMRARAKEYGIDISAAREAPVLAGARYLEQAVQQVRRFVAEEEHSAERGA